MARKLIIFWTDQQMVVVGHETIGDYGTEASIYGETGRSSGGIFFSQQELADAAQEERLVLPVEKDSLTVVATIVDVVVFSSH